MTLYNVYTCNLCNYQGPLKDFKWQTQELNLNVNKMCPACHSQDIEFLQGPDHDKDIYCEIERGDLYLF